MARRSRKNILFPLGGLDRQGSYRQQSPFTTVDCLNVVPKGSIERRDRGGSRPGTMLSHTDNLGGEVRFLQPMTLLPSDGFTSYSDTFDGTVIGSDWTLATWSSDVPQILQGSLASIDSSVADAAVTLKTLPILIAQGYQAEMLIVPYNGAHHGKYRIYMRMDDTTPDYTIEGIVIELVMTGDTGAYTGTITSYTGSTPTVQALTGGTLGSAQAAWLTVLVSGDDVSVFFGGNTLILAHTVDTHSATERGVGFALECTVAAGLCLTWVFRVQYHAATNTLRSKLIGSGNGDIYHEDFYGSMEVVSSSLTVRDDIGITVTQSGQKLYIADYGDLRITGTNGTLAGTTLDNGGNLWDTYGIDTDTDMVVITSATGTGVDGTYGIASFTSASLTLDADAGTGNCTYRIERAPKIYDPAANTLALMVASTGQVPLGCPLIARYLNRIFLAGAEIAPHAWFCSRQGDPLDWDYSQEDVQRAVLGTSSEAGTPGEAVTALVAHSDDYLIIGCRNELWRMRGDPAYGGSLSNISRTIGIISQDAWCLGPEGEMVFLSFDGIFILAPGASGEPQSLTRERLPDEFMNIDPNQMDALLEYDVKRQGVNITLTSKSANTRTHWWIDWKTRRFWPLTLPDGHEPTATCSLQGIAVEDDGIILGGRDGYLRRFSHLTETDCGTAFSSYVLIGPVGLASDMSEGKILAMAAVLAIGSADVTWALRPGSTFENCLTNSNQDTGTWSAGINASDYPACRGQAFALLLTGESGRSWVFEQVTTSIITAGRRRLA